MQINNSINVKYELVDKITHLENFSIIWSSRILYTDL